MTIELFPASPATGQPLSASLPLTGLPMTFVADGCPVLVSGMERGLEVRLIGRVVAANCAQVERVLLGALASGAPITLVLDELDLIDAPGSAMLAGILDASVVVRWPWSIVDLDPVVHAGCADLRGCACSRLRSSIELAPRGGTWSAGPPS